MQNQNKVLASNSLRENKNIVKIQFDRSITGRIYIINH